MNVAFSRNYFPFLLVLGTLLMATGCASTGVSQRPMDTSLATLALADATEPEKGGVEIDLSQGFDSVPGQVKINGIDYDLDFGLVLMGADRRIPPSYLTTMGLANTIMTPIAGRAKIPGSQGVTDSYYELMGLIHPTIGEGFLRQIKANNAKRTVKIGDSWTTQEMVSGKFGLFEKKIHFLASTSTYTLRGFADYQGKRCALIRFTSSYYVHALIQDGLAIGSAVGAQQLDGIMAFDYNAQQICGLIGDGQVNLLGNGALTNPVKFLADPGFQTAMNGISSTVDATNVLFASGGAVAFLGIATGTFANLSARDLANSKIQPLFEAMPATLYPSLVKIALGSGSKVYPRRFEEPIRYQVSLAFRTEPNKKK